MLPFRLLLLMLSIAYYTDTGWCQKGVDVLFYNVENLFDTINDQTNDDEFLPNAKNQWNTERYSLKLSHINQVIDSYKHPLIIGLCEIENEHVLRDLIQFSPKRKNKFGCVHYESKDARGIDAALIYDSSRITLYESGKIRFCLPDQTTATTRDIVWAKFKTRHDTLLVLVNHWPSRRGGQEESESKRIEAARQLKHFTDSIQDITPAIAIVILGDLNDSPTDTSNRILQNSFLEMISENSGIYPGTHYYQKKWEILDHILISHSLTNTKQTLYVVPQSGKINSNEFLFRTSQSEKAPFRTFSGSTYLGGYSDHLPVSIRLRIR